MVPRERFRRNAQGLHFLKTKNMGRPLKPTGSPTIQRRRKAAKLAPFEPARPARQHAKPQGEMKYFDCDYNATAITGVTTTWPAGTITDPLTTINLGSAAVANPLCLVAPTVGSNLNQRVGRKIEVYKVKVHGTVAVPVQAAQTTADTAAKVRLVLVLDQQTNAGQMTGAQLYNDGTASATVINTFQNPNNFGRFRVLKDKMLQIGNPNITGSPTAMDLVQQGLKINFKFTINFKSPVPVHFNATNGGTVADIVDNSIHMLAAVDNTGLGTTLAYYSRVCYRDQ